MPMLVILPHQGDVVELAKYTTSFYARYEKVSNMIQKLPGDEDLQLARSLREEEGMLKQILEWLAVTPESIDGGSD